MLSHVWLFWNPRDCSPPGSSIHSISWASILQWVAISSCRESSRIRDWTHVCCLGGGLFMRLSHWTTREAHLMHTTWLQGPAWWTTTWTCPRSITHCFKVISGQQAGSNCQKSPPPSHSLPVFLAAQSPWTKGLRYGFMEMFLPSSMAHAIHYCKSLWAVWPAASPWPVTGEAVMCTIQDKDGVLVVCLWPLLQGRHQPGSWEPFSCVRSICPSHRDHWWALRDVWKLPQGHRDFLLPSRN